MSVCFLTPALDLTKSLLGTLFGLVRDSGVANGSLETTSTVRRGWGQHRSVCVSTSKSTHTLLGSFSPEAEAPPSLAYGSPKLSSFSRTRCLPSSLTSAPRLARPASTTRVHGARTRIVQRGLQPARNAGRVLLGVCRSRDFLLNIRIAVLVGHFVVYARVCVSCV